MQSRSNEEWIRALRSAGAEQAGALEDLRRYLLRALPRGLKSYGAIEGSLLDDIVQDALVRTLDCLDHFEGRSAFTTWATAIAIRMAFSELRRHRWKDRSLEALGGGDTIAPDAYSDPDASPEDQAAQRAIVATMQQVLETQLSARQRLAVMAELRGVPQAAIGEQLGIGRNAVYKLGHDARKKLKTGLEKAGIDADAIQNAFS